MLPSLFRSSRALPYLSALSVGLAMAALTATVFGHAMGHSPREFARVATITGLPTLAVGTLWAALLRWPRTVGSRRTRLGWWLSIPLAALNASISAVLMFHGLEWYVGAIAGLTVGAIFWVPAMLVVLALFGLPIAWSQGQARRGLLGAERGETAVGAVCASLSLASLIAAVAGRVSHATPPDAMTELAYIVLSALSSLGLAASAGTTALAVSRGRQRLALIEAAESGARSDYRVEHTDAGRVLIRVRPAAADDYRQADTDEESFALDESAQDATDLSTRSPGASQVAGG